MRFTTGNLIDLLPDSTVTVSASDGGKYAGMTFIKTWPGVRRAFGEWSCSLSNSSVIYISSSDLATCLIAGVKKAVRS